MKAAFFVSIVAASDVDCSSTACPSTCSCVESTCDNLYADCVADSQCDGIMNCLMSCSCSDILCSLGCVAGKTLDTVSSNVKSCASGCASGETRKQFEDFKKQFGRSYESAEEEEKRFGIFQQSLERAAELNNMQDPEHGSAFGITRFSDMTQEEFNVRLGAKRKSTLPSVRVASVLPEKMLSMENLPATVDWRTRGSSVRGQAVTTVKDQGQCGSCWAFSATEAVESAYYLAGNAMYDLSPQQVTSCTPDMYGCGGGDTVPAYEYLMAQGGLSSAWFWPYEQSMYEGTNTKRCDSKGHNWTYANYFPIAKVSGYTWATPPCETGLHCNKQDMTALANALVQKGPASICLNAQMFNFYTGGIMSAKTCGGNGMDYVDHCVQLVGYHQEFAEPKKSYWLVRNSWASNWGENGYIRLQLSDNTCGVANEATHAVIAPEQHTSDAYRFDTDLVV